MGLAGTTTSSSILYIKMSKKQQTQDHTLGIHQFALSNWICTHQFPKFMEMAFPKFPVQTFLQENIITKYVLFIINQKISLQLLKHTNLIRLKVLLALSCDVESLLTSVPVKETINYILHKIHVDKSIKPFCKKSIFKILLVKLTKESVFFHEFPFNKANWWIPNGWSCICCFFRHFLCKEDVAVPAKHIFYKRYVDDTYIHRNKNVNDELFQNLNSYHTNIKLTLEENPRKFLYTKIIRKNNTIST